MRVLRWLAVALAACALAGAADAAERIYRVGFLGQTSSPDLARQVDALREGLASLGYEEGRNLSMDFRWADRKLERLPSLARELVGAKVDVIVTHGAAGARAAKEATSSVPIVIAVIGDPVANGVVADLARPGGNVTGLVLQEFESTVKWLDFLKQVLPPHSRIGWLDVPGVETREAEALSRTKEDEAAKARGFEVLRVAVRGTGELQPAFERLSKEAHAVIVPNSSLLNPNAPLIARLAITYRLPTAGSVALARAGGLIGYGADGPAMYRRAARYVDRVLKGAKAGELPMEGPPKLELVVNLKAARALGMRLPAELVAQADERIE